MVAGALLGLFDGLGAGVVGALLGGAIGSVLARSGQALAGQADRLAHLEEEMRGLRRRLEQSAGARRGAGEAPVAEAPVAEAPVAAGAIAGLGTAAPESASPEADVAAPVALDVATSGPDAAGPIPSGPAGREALIFDLPDAASPAPSTQPPAASTAPLAGASVEASASSPIDLDAIYARAQSWLLGGNTLVRVGLLVLFFGLAFLARHAIEHELLPPAMRMGGIAAFGLVLLGLGWRLRERRPGYALSLQGGGVAVLYLSAFAALRLYDLYPAATAFGLMLALVGVAAWLATRQDAPALAVIGAAGGFAAPILASTGAGSHVQLFGYYALLNAGVLVLAWSKAWRGLNLVGFLFTFAIGLLWGARYYHPAHFATVEPFLILFFLMYVAAAVAYARHQAPVLRDPVDGTLVFGVPVVGFGLQAALVADMPYALAWSAAAVGTFYVALAVLLHRLRRPAFALLVTCFAALGVTFLTLALPLAFDGRWSAAAWALEGAALWWVGLRQQRHLVMGAGLLLQAGAAVLFAADLAQHPALRSPPVANSALLGTVMISAAAFFSAWCAATRALPGVSLRPVGLGLLGWAWLWWLGGAWAEIDAHLHIGQRAAAALWLFAPSAWIAIRLAPRLRWPDLATAAPLPLAGMALAAALAFAYGVPPGAHGGWFAWPIALALHLACLRASPAEVLERRALALVHAGGLWVVAFVLSQELGLRAASLAIGSGWQAAAYALPPTALLALLLVPRAGTVWPLSAWRDAYLTWGAAPVAVALALWSLAVQPGSDGDMSPWPFLPLFNPLDLAVFAALATIAWWLHRAAGLLAAAGAALLGLTLALGGIAFVAFNGALLRAVHHLTGIPWRLDALLASATTQATLSLCWAVLGLGLMLFAGRRAQRTPWLVGAALMGVVVVKLFVVDMAASGALARIVSFIGAGLVLLVVGYFSPLPPKR